MANLRKACSWPKIFLFGDSITQYSFSPEGCWGALVADQVQRRCDVLNRGFSGYNVPFCKALLPHILDKATAAETVAFTIFLGANDSGDAVLNPRQHCPLDKYKEGLREMAEFAMSQGISREKIILIAPPAVHEADYTVECQKKGKVMSQSNTVVAKYAVACLEAAKELGTKKVDLYSEMMKDENYGKYLCDGLHLSTKGSKLLYSLLQPLVHELTSHLPEVLFPKWDEVDLNDLEGAMQPQ